MTTITDNDLKPCPFCGSTEVYQEHDYVRCESCSYKGPGKQVSGSGVDVYENWNKVHEEGRGGPELQLIRPPAIKTSSLITQQLRNRRLWRGFKWPPFRKRF
ncbi:Lar family restriction alleviation protein [Candidatus Sororendozoicomonas aggregata]|uniref:Lar family restriction alleviation protein n=1 Tax=Candidatus Sororendozoicomonas aggregata TaxID=3073239 RepID=UPI003B75C4CF